MDFHSIKRRELQSLCKKHSIPANLTNREMANRLTSIFKEKEKCISQGESSVNNPIDIASENDSMVMIKKVKKVRFSPENETFIFPNSGTDSDKEYTPAKKRRGKRKPMVKPVSKKQVQVIENGGSIGLSAKNVATPVRTRSQAQKVVEGDVNIVLSPPVGKRRARRGTKLVVELRDDVEVGNGDGDGKVSQELGRRQLRSREVVVEKSREEGVADLGVSRKNVTRRGSKKRVNARGNDGLVLLDESSEKDIRADINAKLERITKRSKQTSTKGKDSAALSEEVGKTINVGRNTRSRTQLKGNASAVESEGISVVVQEESEKVLQLKEPSMGLARNVLRRKSVVPQEGRVESEILDRKGAEPGMVLRKSKRNVAKGKDSEQTRSITAILNCTVPDGELGTYGTVGRAEQLTEPCLGKDAIVTEKPPRLSRRNASRQNSMVSSNESDEIAVVVEKSGKLKRRREPILNEETHVSEFESLIEKPMRRSTRITSKGDLVAPAELTGKAVEMKQHDRSKIPVIIEKSPLIRSPEELQIEDDGLAVPEAAGNNNNSDSNCSKEVFESSKRKRKKTRGKSSVKKQLSSVKVSTVFSHIEEIINNTESSVEIPVPSPVKFLGVSTSQETLNFATESVVVNEKESNLVVDEKDKSQMDDIVEGEMEEQSPWFLNKKSDIDDRNLIEPEQVQNDVVASEITSPADDFSPPNQLYYAGEPSNLLDLEKGLETEEPSTSKGINPRSDNLVGHSSEDDKTSVQEDQNFVQVEDAHRIAEKVIQEVVIEVHLDGLNESTCPGRNPENSPEKAEELSAIDPSNGEGFAQAETLVEASEMQIVTSESNLGSVESDAERIAELQLSSSGHHASLLSPFKHSPESQERNQPEAQHIANSTMLGRSCTNCVRECFSPETEILDETISRAETSISNASGGMCALEKIEDDKTVEYEHEEACCFEKASAAAVDEIIYEGLEVCDLPAFIKTDGPGVEDKENLTSQGNSEGNSEETREKCMHELSVGDGIHSATLEEKGIDRANFVLQSPSTVDKGMFSFERPLLKDNDEYEQASGIGEKNLSCCRVNLSMDNNIKEQEVNQLKYQFSSSVKDRNLIEALLNESTNSIEKAAEDEKVKANYSNHEASSKDLAGDKSMKGESAVEQCDLIKEADHIVCEEVPVQVIGVADTSLTEAICKSSGISEESVEMAINSAECIESINMLEEEESKTENKSFDANEAKFRDLDDHKEEKISEHEKATIASDNTMSVDGIDDDRKAHDGKVDSDLNLNDYSSDAEMEDNIDAIPQVTFNDIDDDSVEEEILGVNGSDCNGILNHSRADIRAAADEAGLVTMDGKISSRDIENDTKQVEIAPTSLQICKSGRKWEEKNTAEGKLFDDTSFGKTEIGSGDKCEFQVHSDVNSNEAEGKDMSHEDRGNDTIDTDLPFQVVDEVAMEKRVGAVKGNEDLIDAKKGFNEENIARTSEKVSKEQLDHEGAAKDAGSHQLDDKVVTGDDSRDFLDFENLFVLSSSKPEMGVECSPLSPVIAYSDHENMASEFHVESPMLTTWEMNLILGGVRDEVEKSDGGALESNLLSQEFEDAMEVKEHVTIIEQEDQLVAEKQPDEQEHHAHLVVSDEPICDGGEGTNEKDDVSAINKEYIDHENHEDESVEAHISTHKVMLTDDVIVSGRNYAASENPLAECGHRDLEQEEYIANPGVQDIFGNSTHPMLLTGGKREEKNSEEIILFADSSRGRPEIGSSSAAVSWLNVPASYEEEYNPCTYRMEVSNEARGKETTGEDKGTDPTDMNSLFQEDDKVTMEKSVGPQKDNEGLCDATDGYNVESNVTDSQEAAKEQLDGCRDAFHEAIVMDGTDFLSLNSPVCGDECKSHVAEAESANGLHKLDRKVDTLEVANIDVVSSLKPEMVVDCSVGNVPTDMVSLFQEDDEAPIGERVGALNDDEGLDDATDGFSVENNVIDSQEAAKKQLDGHKDVTHEAIDFLASNQSLYGGESKTHVAEAEETHSLHKLDDKVVTAGDTIEVAEFENLDCVSSLKPGMVVDCSAVSPVSASSYHENKGLEYHVESHIFTTLEMNLFSSNGDQDDSLESGSGAPETSMTNENAGETEENAMIVEQVAEEQLSEHKQQMAEEFAEANKEAGEDSNDQDDIYAIIQGSIDCKNHRDEPVKVESSQVSSEDMKMTEVAEINGNHPFASYKATSGCDSNDLEGDNIANSGIDDLKFSVERNKSEDIGEAMELSKDLTKLYAKVVDQSPVFINSAIGKDIVAEDFQRVSLQKKSPDGKKEESSSLFAKQLSSSIMKRRNNKAILIQRTPKRFLARDMKENAPSTKSEQVGNMTAPPALSKRRALEDLRKN